VNKTSKIHIAGHRGLASSANVRALQTSGHTNIITRTHAELGPIDQRAVDAFYDQARPEYVVLAFSRPSVAPALAGFKTLAKQLATAPAVHYNVIHAT